MTTDAEIARIVDLLDLDFVYPIPIVRNSRVETTVETEWGSFVLAIDYNQRFDFFSLQAWSEGREVLYSSGKRVLVNRMLGLNIPEGDIMYISNLQETPPRITWERILTYGTFYFIPYKTVTGAGGQG
jgi:hypothetical protein